MAEEQQLKKEAAVGYDYDADPRWADYWSNVLVPSHLAARPEVLRHFKLKFYQRYVDPDLLVEPLSAISSPRSSPSSEPRQRRPAGDAPAAADATGSENARQPEGSAPAPSRSAAPSPFKLDSQSIEFLANAWITVMSVLAVFPFLPFVLADKAVRLALLGSAGTNLYTILTRNGMPRSYNLQALQYWLGSVFNATGSEFLYLIYALLFVSASMPLKVSVIPLAIRSLEQVVYYLRRNFSNTQLYRNYLDKPSNWVTSNANLLKHLSANAEIGLGFLLVILLLTPQRNIIHTFVHWRLLKVMNELPTTAPYHRSSWQTIGRQANPLISRYTPFLRAPIGYLQRWFSS